MEIAFDFGGSTTDAVFFEAGLQRIQSYESKEIGIDDLGGFLEEVGIELEGVNKLYVTGGKSRFFGDEVNGVSVVKVSEIDAIGYGGWHIADSKCRMEHGGVLVVSMGTGTCIVSVDCGLSTVNCKHIGGTGVGGGTFLGLSKGLLGLTDLNEVLNLGSEGMTTNVDVSVEEIVGGGVGRVSGEATASNLGKLISEIDFEKKDLAAGIINLIGQTIGATAVFAAQAEDLNKIVLTGKLTKAGAIIKVIKGIIEDYGMEVIVPENAEFASAIGAKMVEFSKK